MKILYIAPKYHQGIVRQGYSFEHINFYKTLVDLDNGAHTVVYVPFDEVMDAHGRAVMNAKLLATAEEERPALCFVSLITDEITPQTIHALTRRFPTCGWFGDDEWRFETHTRNYARSFTYVCTTSPAAAASYYALGCQNVIITAGGVNTAIFKPTVVMKDIPVSFIGSWNKERGSIVREIEKAGIPVQAYGSGWKQGRIHEEAMVDVISRSVIGLGLNPPSFYVGWKPLARLLLKRGAIGKERNHIMPDFWNFKANFQEWQRKKIPQLKARTFEIPACRTLLLTQELPALKSFYIPGKEIAVYQRDADIVPALRYYLAEQEETAEITEAGYQRTIREHTYAHRFQAIFQAMHLPV